MSHFHPSIFREDINGTFSALDWNSKAMPMDNYSNATMVYGTVTPSTHKFKKDLYMILTVTTSPTAFASGNITAIVTGEATGVK